MVQLGIIKEDKTMSDNINNTNPPSEPLTREEEYLSAIAGVTSSDDIPEKPLTRTEKYLNKIVENGGGGGGGGFTPTQAQLDAMNSGITSEDVEQISTNKNNISALDTNTTLLKNTITTIRFSQGVTRTITFPRPNYNMFIVFGFVQGVGLVNWDCRSSNDGVLSVRDVLTGSSVTQDTITYTRDLDAGTATVTISSNVNQWSYLTIIKNAEIT